MKLTMNNQKKNKRLALLVACSFGLSVAFGIAPVGTTNDMGLLGGSIVEAASSQSGHVTGHDKKDKKGKKQKKHGKVKKPTKPQQKVKKDGRGKNQKCTAKMLSGAASRAGLSVPAYAYYMGYIIVTEEEYTIYEASPDFVVFVLVDDSDVDWDDLDIDEIEEETEEWEEYEEEYEEWEEEEEDYDDDEDFDDDEYDDDEDFDDEDDEDYDDDEDFDDEDEDFDNEDLDDEEDDLDDNLDCFVHFMVICLLIQFGINPYKVINLNYQMQYFS